MEYAVTGRLRVKNWNGEIVVMRWSSSALKI
jgi:hypothetical protein